MSKQLELAPKPYGPPFAADRAWESDDDVDGWSLIALRDGFVDVIDSAIKIAERDHALAEPTGVERVRFRSNRMPRTLRSLDPDIVVQVMSMRVDDDENEIEKIAQWRRDNAEQLAGYPRAVLDAFANDVAYAVEAAGRWDKYVAERWADAWHQMESLAIQWLPREKSAES